MTEIKEIAKGVYLDVTDYPLIDKIAVPIPNEIKSLELNILPDFLPNIYKDGVYIRGNSNPIIVKGLLYVGDYTTPVEINSMEDLDIFFKYNSSLNLLIGNNKRCIMTLKDYKKLRNSLIYKNESLVLLREFLKYVQSSYMFYDIEESDYTLNDVLLDKTTNQVLGIPSKIVLENIHRLTITSGLEFLGGIITPQIDDLKLLDTVFNVFGNLEKILKELMLSKNPLSVRVTNDNNFIYIEFYLSPSGRRYRIKHDIKQYSIENLIIY